MFHFYEKNREYIRCEITEAAGHWHIVITEPNGHESAEDFTTAEQAHDRWKALNGQFADEGWFGPYGRE